MSTYIYTRNECKKLINELGIIKFGKNIVLQRPKITPKLMESILFHTKKCRDRLSEKFYWILNNIEDYPNCRECGKQFKPRFYGLKTAYQRGENFCSNSCISKNSVIQEKKKQTCLKNLGVENPSQSKDVQQKMQETCLKKYGVYYSLQSQEIKEKSRQTCEEKYGCSYAIQNKEVQEKRINTCLERYNVEHTFQSEMIREKGKQTCLERLGVENASQSEEVQNKKKQTWLKNLQVDHPWKSELVREKCCETNLKNLGVKHPLQNIEIFKKVQDALYNNKNMILPSGLEVTYQGYENVAITTLLGKGYLEEQLVLDRDLIPIIKYEFENKSRVYFPDIFIPHENKIIEVKSTWTYEKDLEQNLAKRQACLDQGYSFEFWICSNKELLQIL
jgi:hypothetical protein